MEVKQTESDETKLTSLRDFIEDYQRVITVIGVFVALALFWKNIRTAEPTPYISYLCILTTVPLLIEVNRGYVYAKSSWNLVAFINLINGVFVFTVYYLVTDYPQHFARILTGSFLFLSFIGLMALQVKLMNSIKQMDYKRRVSDADILKLQDVPVLEINKRVERQLQKSVTLMGLLDIVSFVGVVAAALLVSIFADQYITASLDVIFDRNPQIEAPQLPKSSPLPNP